MRNFFHVVISLLMWLLFGYYWYVVSGREIGEETIQALTILSVVIVVGLAITLWWVAHNKRLARRNRRQGSLPAVGEPFDRDYLQRPIEAPEMSRLQSASVIEITLAPLPGQDPSVQYPGKKKYTVIRENP